MKISFFVIISHLLVFGYVCYFQTPSEKKEPRKRVVVKTQVIEKPKFLKLDQPISLLVEPPPQESTPPQNEDPLPVPQVHVQAPPKSDKPKKDKVSATALAPKIKQPAKPIETKVPLKSTPKPAQKQSSKPSVKKAGGEHNPNQDKLIALMQQSLKTLETSPPHKTEHVQRPKALSIEKLASENLSFEAKKYEEELILYLESLISLPEKGDVKLKLCLNKQGCVQKIDILKCESERNKKYISSTLPSCTFPQFNSHFKGESTHTFSITLKSE